MEQTRSLEKQVAITVINIIKRIALIQSQNSKDRCSRRAVAALN